MEETHSNKTFDFTTLQELEDKIERVLLRLAELKAERDEALKQKSELENILNVRDTRITQLETELEKIKKEAIPPEKAEKIKARLNSLLERLNSIE